MNGKRLRSIYEALLDLRGRVPIFAKTPDENFQVYREGINIHEDFDKIIPTIDQRGLFSTQLKVRLTSSGYGAAAMISFELEETADGQEKIIIPTGPGRIGPDQQIMIKFDPYFDMSFMNVVFHGGGFIRARVLALAQCPSPWQDGYAQLTQDASQGENTLYVDKPWALAPNTIIGFSNGSKYTVMSIDEEQFLVNIFPALQEAHKISEYLCTQGATLSIYTRRLQ